jgi:biofilm PGA synthesis N-glycosyltransferase PgaC
MQWLPAILILPYLFLFLKIYRGLLKINPFIDIYSPRTFVSVVVACRNEQKNLPFLLEDIALQDYPKELFEVIIVDDNSTDRTFETASAAGENGNIITVCNVGSGKKQAIRTGINISSGSLIITTDADCRMGKKWIRGIASFYEKHIPDMIICPVQVDTDDGFFAKFQELEFLSLQGITAGSASAGEGVMCNGANLAFTKKAYLDNRNNLHDELESGDDIFLLQSLKSKDSSKILWLESIDSLVTAASAPDIESFMRQRSRWISKAKAYDDGFTILLGIVTFVTILLEISLLLAGFFDPEFFLVFLCIFLLKSVPDFLILLNTTRRYGKKELMIWFLPSRIIYPFYVFCVWIYSLISHFGKKLDSH